ncbi:MAG TPA: ThuA domain-containing protein [Bryobacteraceae bacterium]|nr:ThuA domain-containing protein [Bryobacteraceae bacterium]
MRTLLLVCLLAAVSFAAPQKALIVDGQNNHKWQETTPVMKKALEDTGLFTVDVATSPPKGSDMSSFKPDFKSYDVVISNYSDYGGGGVWSPETQKAFEEYVSKGGGFVSVHAADNAFPGWLEYNKMIGVGGWGGRDEKSGPMLRWRYGKVARDTTPGAGGHHGKQHEYKITARDKNHPILKGLPEVWMHAQDELYDALRGPAEHVTVLATAFSDKATGGTGEHEPALMVIQYGKGRVFHTILGHGAEAMRCAGFLTTFTRGVEWAASGKVTQKPPQDFPRPDRVSLRQ